MRYNSQFYASALKVPTPNRLYRDDSNGAITMELSENKKQDVVDAFERAGTPLQTDENGNIIPETPAHFREVYGVDYTDVLAEYGLL